MGKSTIDYKWPFSIAMLNYLRVNMSSKKMVASPMAGEIGNGKLWVKTSPGTGNDCYIAMAALAILCGSIGMIMG